LFFLFVELLRGTVASALASITYNNMTNQTLAASMGALKLVVDLMQDREFGIRYKVSLAIEALAMNNVENQKQFLSKHLNVQKPLNELMEVIYIYIYIRERKRTELNRTHFLKVQSNRTEPEPTF
jgi:hypothetical protein